MTSKHLLTAIVTAAALTGCSLDSAMPAPGSGGATVQRAGFQILAANKLPSVKGQCIAKDSDGNEWQVNFHGTITELLDENESQQQGNAAIEYSLHNITNGQTLSGGATFLGSSLISAKATRWSYGRWGFELQYGDTSGPIPIVLNTVFLDVVDSSQNRSDIFGFRITDRFGMTQTPNIPEDLIVSGNIKDQPVSK